jgi:hypothetical protein
MTTMTHPPIVYEIRVRGHLSPTWSDWFDGLKVTTTEQGDTVLAGPLADQTALFGIVGRIQALNLTLLAITRHDENASLASSGSTERVS